MPKLTHYIFSLIIFNSSLVLASTEFDPIEPWLLKNKSDNVSIYYRKLLSGNIEFKGVTYVTTSLNSLVALLFDVKSMPNWVFNVDSAEILEQVSDVEGYSYVVNSAFFPFSKRDSVVHTIIFQDPITLAVTIDGQSVPDYIPEFSDKVRLTLVKSFWKFTPIKDGQVEVVFQGLGEPGGDILASISHSGVFQWVAEKILWQLPKTSLDNLKQEVKKTKYQQKTFPFIKEKIDIIDK